MTETRVGVDVGGTFTDVVTVADGQIRVDKVPSTPDAPERGVLDGLSAARVDPTRVTFLGHGTTVATNAVLEGEWAETALVTTAGFADALEIGRQTRPDIYDFDAAKPDPVVPRDRRFGVPERIDERGEVLRPLDEDRVRDLADRLANVESVAVSTLFAFENPTHEERIVDLLREAGVAASVSRSSQVLPEIREYERTLATALNAGLKPVMDAYLAALADGTAARGIDAPLRIMGSNGGLLAADAARDRPVTTLLSGPAAGVRGAVFVAGRAGHSPDTGDVDVAGRDTGEAGTDDVNAGDVDTVETDAAAVDTAERDPSTPNERNDGTPRADHATTATDADGDELPDGDAGYADLLTMDMGGTSCDVSLVRGGEPTLSTETTVGGYPVSVPTVDVHTVGAGGGSIAHVDAGGALRVGPQSAGADPGPVCYGRGGDAPTVTDAHLLLGRIDPSAFVADGVGAETATVREAFEPLAAALDRSVRETARGTLAVANAATERALRVVSVERGLDPREFTLVAFGGAGPLHAAALADRLDVPELIVPRAAGTLSALGLLVSDLTYDYAASMVRPWAAVTATDLRERFAAFEREGRAALAETATDTVRVERSVDLRYAGQSFDLRVPVTDDPDPDAIRERFHERHRCRYGHAEPGEPVELVTVRLRVRGVVDPPSLAAPDRAGSVADSEVDRREVVTDEPRETPVYDRSRLPLGCRFDGPAVIEGAESTVVVPPSRTVRVDANANLLLQTPTSDDEAAGTGGER